MKTILNTFLGASIVVSFLALGLNNEEEFITKSSKLQVCHADHDYHQTILGNYLNETRFLADRNSHGTNGITLQSVQLVQHTDSACAMLDSIFATSLSKTYGGTSDKLYKFTYYKYDNFLFVSRSIALSSDPNRFATGISTFDIFNSNGTHIYGYAF